MEENRAGAGTPKQAAANRTRKRKWPIVAGVAAVVLVAAGAGFWVWHEQPSFCNAVCHVPMDNYVEGYYNDAALLANMHERADTTCLECHEPKIDEQVGEAVAWASGDFETNEAGDIVRTGVTADKKMCARAGCHDWEGVVAATEDWGGKAGVNPHASHQGEAIDYSNCHGVHRASQMYCNTCHDYEVPAGWTSAQQKEGTR